MFRIEEALVYFKMQSKYSPRWTEEYHKIPQDRWLLGRGLKPGSPQHEIQVEMLNILPKKF
jgi:hypothetical protein